MEKISIVIPTFNEEGNVQELHEQIMKVGKENDYDLEIIFVNDGSTDRTLEKLKELNNVVIINFRGNFGQTAAMDAGIKHASGDVIITMDADLQNDPNDIPRLMSKLNQGNDVVAGWRYKRKDDFLKNFMSRGANWLRGLLVKDGIHDSGCTLKAFRRECFNQLDLFGEMHRFIPGLLKIQGYKVTEIKVRHHARKSGVTKYNSKRILKGFLDMMAIWFWRKYANRPLHLFGGLGLLIMVLSVLAGAVAIYLKFAQNIDLTDNALTLITVFGLLIGIQLLISGLLADVLIKNYFAQTKSTPYHIGEVIKQ